MGGWTVRRNAACVGWAEGEDVAVWLSDRRRCVGLTGRVCVTRILQATLIAPPCAKPGVGEGWPREADDRQTWRFMRLEARYAAIDLRNFCCHGRYSCYFYIVHKYTFWSILLFGYPSYAASMPCSCSNHANASRSMMTLPVSSCDTEKTSVVFLQICR